MEKGCFSRGGYLALALLSTAVVAAQGVVLNEIHYDPADEKKAVGPRTW
jgi:hypothetical protein